ncbi:type II secretion system protein [Pseudoalteromonas sp. J010]|uniref:type II secretion system protein n=1 Tax=Pseudoalteromonas sp. J010 TaxID=998465 RepID=UPI000F647F2A|nr:type II secretion system protein [Pseudoalteromonas sp. J010]RRS10579.1 type II secretion system protein [Pseudoalteromonas sp. J010]
MKYQKGISLLELAILTSLLAVIAGIGFSAFNKQQTRADYLVTEQQISDAENILLNHLQTYRRLPCADLDSDGIEDCNGARSQYGTLPYITLGLDGVISDAWNQPVRYGVSMSLSEPQPAIPVNMYRLCEHIHTAATSDMAANAFFLVSGGLKEYDSNKASNDRTSLDGNVDTVNEQYSGATVTFVYDKNNEYQSAAGTRVSDDKGLSKTFLPLLGELNCTGLLLSANSMENQIQAFNLQKAAFDATKSSLDGTLNDIHNVRVESGVNIAAAAAQTASMAAGALDGVSDVLVGDPSTASAFAANAAAVASTAIAIANSIEALVNAKKTENRTKKQQERIVEYQRDRANICSKLHDNVVAQKGSAIACKS